MEHAELLPTRSRVTDSDGFLDITGGNYTGRGSHFETVGFSAALLF